MCAACVMAPLAAVDTGDTRSDRETQIHLANILCHIVKQNNEAVGTHLQVLVTAISTHKSLKHSFQKRGGVMPRWCHL